MNEKVVSFEILYLGIFLGYIQYYFLILEYVNTYFIEVFISFVKFAELNIRDTKKGDYIGFCMHVNFPEHKCYESDTLDMQQSYELNYEQLKCLFSL